LRLRQGEILLRFLPVCGAVLAAPVNKADPVFHHDPPNQTTIYSRDWSFSIVNRVHVNNAGYVNDQDYDANDPRPLFAVVGDSYVEALMVPKGETLHARLARAVAPSGRVYSFASSGAPLSQYLVWAKDARSRWRAQALAVVVVGNDFDESLAVYKSEPGFHYYVEQPSGELILRRVDYRRGYLRWWVERSALLRYMLFNMQVVEHLKPYLKGWPFVRAAQAEVYVGNTNAEADAVKLARSKAAVDQFLRDMVSFSGWPPDKVVFVVDGIRYPTDNPVVLTSYFVQMRTYFITEARKVGFEAIDMDEKFFPRVRAGPVRFDFPTDAHWNGLGHGLAAEAVAASDVFSNWRHKLKQAARRRD
jgi:hypothetical protein